MLRHPAITPKDVKRSGVWGKTTLSQVEAILAKTRSTSQTEVLRFVLSLRSIVLAKASEGGAHTRGKVARHNWIEDEVWKPFEQLTLHDGRLMEHLVQGPAGGAPVLLTHAGNGQICLPKEMLRMAYEQGVRLLSPIRAGYGKSDNLKWGYDVLSVARADTAHFLDHIGVTRLP